MYFSGFDVAKTGDARIGFVGFPSVGKSTLLSNLAGVYSEVAAYEFTTLTTVPGVIRYKGAKIQVQELFLVFLFPLPHYCFLWDVNFSVLCLPAQLLDLPGIIEGAKDGKGRGRQVIAGRICSHELSVGKTDAECVPLFGDNVPSICNQCLQLAPFSSSGSNLQPAPDCARCAETSGPQEAD